MVFNGSQAKQILFVSVVACAAINTMPYTQAAIKYEPIFALNST